MTFSTYEYWQKANIFGLPTSYLPHLVIVVCERPLQQIEVSGLRYSVKSKEYNLPRILISKQFLLSVVPYKYWPVIFWEATHWSRWSKSVQKITAPSKWVVDSGIWSLKILLGINRGKWFNYITANFLAINAKFWQATWQPRLISYR